MEERRTVLTNAAYLDWAPWATPEGSQRQLLGTFTALLQHMQVRCGGMKD
jgi:hypothetical protein